MTLATITAVIVTTIVFLGLDAVCLKAVIGPFVEARIGHLMRPDPLLGIAAGFYAFFAVGIVYFAVMPGPSVVEYRTPPETVRCLPSSAVMRVGATKVSPSGRSSGGEAGISTVIESNSCVPANSR
mgnify:CR=1 FL=1